MMTVKELREELAQFDDDMVVVRMDNTGGFEDIYTVEEDEAGSNFDDDEHEKGCEQLTPNLHNLTIG